MPGAPLQLTAGEVRVWYTDLTLPDATLRDCAQMLGEDELQRAARFKMRVHRNCFVAARAFLRQVLAAYQGIRPEAVRFRYTALGKPELLNDPGLKFSLSHSRDFAAAAVVRNRLVGIDVEVVRDNLDVKGLSRRFFAPGEWQRVEQAAQAEQLRLFFAYWTCKEAYLKARGVGLFGALDGFEILPDGDSKHAAIRIFEGDQLAQWSVRRLNLQPRIAGAVVIEGTDYELICGSWFPISSDGRRTCVL